MTMALSPEQDGPKRAAAARAIEEVEDGMVLGLGSGSTAAFALEELAARIAKGLHVAGIPTSEKAAALARRLGVPLTSFAEHRHVDLTIDGADQVERGTLNLVKGLGGALVREKIVAAATRQEIIVVDDSKLVDHLGQKAPLPVEVVRFSHEATMRRLERFGCVPKLRTKDGSVFVTDNGNYIADCRFQRIDDPKKMESDLNLVPGVVDNGLFVGLTSKVIVASRDGIKVLEKNR